MYDHTEYIDNNKDNMNKNNTSNNLDKSNVLKKVPVPKKKIGGF